MTARLTAAWRRLPPILRITLESAALAVGVDSLQKLLGYTAPADQPLLAFLVNEAKVAAPILLLALRALQNARPAPAEVQAPDE